MDKYNLIEIKKKLLSLSLAGVMLGTSCCTNNKDENKVPKRVSIPSEYYHIDEYYKYAIQDGEALKFYKSQNIYLLYNKETYEVKEYIYNEDFWSIELYDLESEEMLVHTGYNRDYYEYMIENNYQVCLKDVNDYIEGHSIKEYYSFEQIKELEPQILESLKMINEAKVK